jgi:hypothetical protein
VLLHYSTVISRLPTRIGCRTARQQNHPER